MARHWIMSAEELQMHLSTLDFTILDCRFYLDDTARGEKEYSDGHIPGAIYAHLENDLSGSVETGRSGRHPLPDKKAFTETLRQWGISTESKVVVFDQGHGGIAARAWWMMRWAGIEDVKLLDGGWNHWKASGLPVTRSIPVKKRSEVEPMFNDSMLATVDAVKQASGAGTLVDARSTRRFSGEEEPIDPVAGHIPGATNLPFMGNLNESGLWKSPAELARRFSEVADGAVVYCGSGVTACHDILAMEESGMERLRLYPGSWSHWITSPDRPVATGDKD